MKVPHYIWLWGEQQCGHSEPGNLLANKLVELYHAEKSQPQYAKTTTVSTSQAKPVTVTQPPTRLKTKLSNKTGTWFLHMHCYDQLMADSDDPSSLAPATPFEAKMFSVCPVCGEKCKPGEEILAMSSTPQD
jgi:hypothetical protein